jgi:hypothetical protein
MGHPRPQTPAAGLAGLSLLRAFPTVSKSRIDCHRKMVAHDPLCYELTSPARFTENSRSTVFS